MPLRSRRQILNFFTATAALTAIAPLAKAQIRSGPPTLDDVRHDIAESDKYPSIGPSLVVESVLRVRIKDSAAALSLFQQYIEERKTSLDKRTLTNALVATIRPGGNLGFNGDMVFAGYSNPPAQAQAAKTLIAAGADAKYRLENRGINGYTVATKYQRYVDNYTLLHAASEDRNFVLVKVLVEDGGADVSAIAVWSLRTARNSKPTEILDRQSMIDGAAMGDSYRHDRDNYVTNLTATLLYLKAHGAEPTANRYCSTLTANALRGDKASIQAWRDAGLPMDIRDADGHTAADYISGRVDPAIKYREQYQRSTFYKLDTREKAEILRMLEEPQTPKPARVAKAEATLQQ